jgi:hypothetical protein
MASDESIGRAEVLSRTGYLRKGSIGPVAEAIDDAIQARCKPLVEAVGRWWDDHMGDRGPDGYIIYDDKVPDIVAEARKLKEVK